MSVDRILAFLRLPANTPAERSVLKLQTTVILGASVFLIVSYAIQREVWAIVDREHLQLILRVWDGLAWFVWPLAAPVMLLLVRRFPLVRGKIGRHLLRLLLWSFVLYFAIAHLRLLLRVLPNLWLPASADVPIDWPNYAVTTIVLMPIDFLTYCGFFATTLAIDYYFKLRRRAEETLQLQLRAAQLESDLAHAELKALRGQLHPHFLFNSFNAVTMLMRQRRNDAAVEVIAQLSTLLRLALERTGKQQLSLEEEMDFIRRYLQIEWIRFGEKLLLEFNVEPAALRATVPNLVLQPLVENAIKHGISRRTEPGTLRITAQRHEDRVRLEIENDGSQAAPISAEDGRSGGLGLANTRARLEKVYGSDYHLEMIHRVDGGMRVRLELPWRPLPPPAPRLPV